MRVVGDVLFLVARQRKFPSWLLQWYDDEKLLVDWVKPGPVYDWKEKSWVGWMSKVVVSRGESAAVVRDTTNKREEQI